MNHDKKTILVVDDEMRIRKLLSDFLVRAGYEVMEAADGEEAISAVYTKTCTAYAEKRRPRSQTCACRSRRRGHFRHDEWNFP